MERKDQKGLLKRSLLPPLQPKYQNYSAYMKLNQRNTKIPEQPLRLMQKKSQGCIKDLKLHAFMEYQHENFLNVTYMRQTHSLMNKVT